MGCAILHAFNWTFDEIREELRSIKDAGYNAVLVSPITYSHGTEWFKRYQPLDLRVIRSPLGGKQEFVNLLTAAASNEYQIDIIVDVVINHMAHREIINGREDLNFPGFDEIRNYANDTSFQDDRLYGDLGYNQFSEHDFNPKQIIRDYSNIDEVRRNRLGDYRVPNGLPDLEVNDWVIDQQKQLLKALLGLGVKGFRVDAVKHVPIHHLTGLTNDPVLRDIYYFAEVIPEPQLRVIKDVLRSTSMSLYDFPLFDQIRYCFSYVGNDGRFYWGNSFRNLESYENAKVIGVFRSVSFVNTHDMPNNDGMKKQLFLGIEDELLAYAYILGRDGSSPLIFTEKGDKENQTYTDNDRWKQLYRHPDIVKMLEFHNRAHGSAMSFRYVTDGAMVVERKSIGFFAINKTSHTETYQVTFATLDGVFRDLFTGTSITIAGRNGIITIPPRSKMMFLPV